MKILRLYTRLPPLSGGMENHIAQLTLEQINLGHDVAIYFNKGNNVTTKDVQVSRLPLYKLKPQFIGFLFFYFLTYLRLVFNHQKFDLVHIHGDWSSLVFSKLIKKVVGAKKIIISIHDELSDNFLSKKALVILLDNVDMIFASGYGVAYQLNKITNKNVIVQPSGIQHIFFEKRERSFNKSSFQVIITASLVKKKNLGLVLDIAKDLPLLRFIIVGDGPEKKYLLNRIKFENIVNVQILGFKNSTELHLLYYKSDIFMLTSIKEGTPTAMLEAMACGLPIISSNAGGVKSILDKHNYIIEQQSKKMFVSCLSSLDGNIALRKRISVQNVIQSKKYTWRNVALNIDKYFQN